MANSSLRYRPEIDGLRAIAVWAVVLYHFFPHRVPGGYLGVDVFFVISGFLITSIITTQAQKGTFSYVDFYVRRIRRLLPALIVVVTTCLVAGYVLLWPDEYRNLAKHTFVGMLFGSNVLLWKEVGYFDPLGAFKPLLHLWSLSVEEQFYVFWPALLLLALRWRRPAVLIGVLATLSFGACVIYSHVDSTARFYLLPFRVWEFMLGAALVFLPGTRWYAAAARFSSFISAAALLTLVAVFFRVSSHLTPNILVAALAAITLIAFGQRTWVGTRLLSQRVFVWFGLLSYSLYLWHYPVLSFYTLNLAGRDVTVVKLLLLLITVALAALTYTFVERPARFSLRGRVAPRHIVVASGVLSTTGLAVFLSGGLPQRFTGSATYAVVQSLRWTDDDLRQPGCLATYEMKPDHFCLTDQRGSPATVVLLGDSHANHLFSGLAPYFRMHGDNLLNLGSGGCLTFFGLTTYAGEGQRTPICPDKDQYMRAIAADPHIHTVLIAARGPFYIIGNDYTNPPSPVQFRLTSPDLPGAGNAAVYEHTLALTLRAFLSAGKQVVFFTDNPEMLFNPNACFNLRPIELFHPTQSPCAVSRDSYRQRNASYLGILASTARRFPQVKFIDLPALFCDPRWCWAVRGGQELYRDDDHLSKAGSAYVARAFARSIQGRREQAGFGQPIDRPYSIRTP